MIWLEQFKLVDIPKKLQLVTDALEEFKEVKIFTEMKEKLNQITQPGENILTAFWSIITEVYSIVIAEWKQMDVAHHRRYGDIIKKIQQHELQEQEDADTYLLNAIQDD